MDKERVKAVIDAECKEKKWPCPFDLTSRTDKCSWCHRNDALTDKLVRVMEGEMSRLAKTCREH